MPKIIHLASFRKTEATTQTVLPDIQFHLRIRIVEKCQNGDFAAAFCVNLEGKCNIIMRNFSHKAKDIFLMCWPLVKKAFVFHLSYALNHSARFLSPLLNSLLLCKYPHSKEWASFCGEEKSDNWPLHCHISRLGTTLKLQLTEWTKPEKVLSISSSSWSWSWTSTSFLDL